MVITPVLGLAVLSVCSKGAPKTYFDGKKKWQFLSPRSFLGILAFRMRWGMGIKFFSK